MKNIPIILGTALLSVLLGCASAPVVIAPVGPNPVGARIVSAEGRLLVYSGLEAESDNENQGGFDNPAWYQHTDYNIYTRDGKLVRHVENSIGHYEQAPRLVSLPTGQYYVKARAADYMWVKVPVTIKRGLITKVHLDDQWMPPTDIASSQVVSLPNGKPVGWRN
jgi:hypothetical protein